ncbi:MAG: hypothetical protein N2747_10890 [Chitinophagaceae bacterium]|nr:hypothetical protein [Chitinophagaceae bacterium]
MARPHHRKKHKTHLKQFRQSHFSVLSDTKAKTKAVSLFTLAGGITGLAIGYFASGGVLFWVVVGLLIGGAIGYLLGNRIENENKNA